MNRNYGIDLLKATAMLMVVAHHVLMTLGAKEGPAVLAFHVLCYCAVDCFVMATGFVMCRKEWKWQRIVRLWRQVVGYSLARRRLRWRYTG